MSYQRGHPDCILTLVFFGAPISKAKEKQVHEDCICRGCRFAGPEVRQSQLRFLRTTQKSAGWAAVSIEACIK